jgi:TolB-like protein/Tfp pilus assembly protein PilF
MSDLRQRYRFGGFEFLPGPGDLFDRGRKVRLQSQIARLLEVLLQRTGTMVSRDELRTLLWPGGTFVDFDSGLNKAVSKLRTALRDRSGIPRFLETLPRKGYRFIGVVEAGGNEMAPHSPRRIIKSLAILPLVDHSPGAEDYFSDGMTAELIAAVSCIQSLRVISRTSVMRLKHSTKSLAAIARELGVDAVVEGTVARSADRVRISAQLIFVPEDRHIWSATFERDLFDVLLLQAEVAQSIAAEINQRIDGGRKLTRRRPMQPEAFEAFLRGTYLRDRMTPADLEASIEHFGRATELDPDYAQAYAGLSQSHFFQGVFGVLPPAESFPKARVVALKALALDDTVAAAHNALAAVHIFYDWDWVQAEAECRKAIQLSPGDPAGWVHMADYLSIQGRHREAIDTFRRALAMDPISRVYRGHFGLILFRARLYDQSLEQCRKAIEIDSTYANAFWFMALSLEKIGRMADAIAALQKALDVSGGGLHFRALLGRAYALTGDRERAMALLGELERLAKTRYVSPFDLAVLKLGLGQKDDAMVLLETAWRQRVFRLIELAGPMFDEMRDDPQWKDLVRRVGLHPIT